MFGGVPVIAMAHIVGAARRPGHGGNPRSGSTDGGANSHTAAAGHDVWPEGAVCSVRPLAVPDELWHETLPDLPYEAPCT
ncbi:hypothetical protein ACFYYD_03950 [Streptomyces bluensis]|uniref:hypothetical protein n=1 Tax=Streptomyces bluensis TaxID=33897 RepID=UPI0036C9E0CC